jgi:hypothetical protein
MFAPCRGHEDVQKFPAQVPRFFPEGPAQGKRGEIEPQVEPEEGQGNPGIVLTVKEELAFSIFQTAP